MPTRFRRGLEVSALWLGRVAAMLLLILGALTLARGVHTALLSVVRPEPLVEGLIPAGLLITAGGAIAGAGWLIVGLINRHTGNAEP